MKLRHILPDLSRSRPTRRPNPATVKRHRRPLLEALEDRLAPAVFNVNSTADILNPAPGTVTLRSAIEAANATPGGNTINLTVAGTYLITTPNTGADDNSTGEFAILPSGGDLTIANTSGGAVAVDGGGLDRVFDINPGDAATAFTVTMQGLTIQNGNSTDGGGGGIRAQGGANLVLTDCTVTGNTALDGGGVFAQTVTLSGCTVSSNTTAPSPNIGAGGGIEAKVSATLTNCTVEGNTSSYDGGGIGCVYAATLVNCTISGNTTATFGGGVLDVFGPVTLSCCTVSDNSAIGFGGGLELEVGNSTVSLTSCTVSGNSARDGGGIDASGIVSLANCTLTGNSATEGGGCYFASNSAPAKLDGCNFTGNSAEVGGGVYNLGDLSVNASTLSGNSATDQGGGLENDQGATASLTGCTLSGNSSGFDGGGIDNSASTVTLTDCTFQSNSAVEAGGGLINISLTQTATADLTDCTFTGNSAGTNGGGGVANDFTATAALTDCTLQNNTATGIGGGFLNTVQAGATLTGCTIDGNSTTSFGGGVSNYGSATLTDCTINGNSAVDDGGVTNLGTIGLNGCTISDNSATGDGGGLTNLGTATLIDCTLSANSAELGGGIINDSGTVNLTGCTLTGNAASSEGGGIYNATGATLNGNDSSIRYNVTAFPLGNGGGGGLFNAGTATLTDCTVANNVAFGSTGFGGGVGSTSGSIAALTTLVDCTVANNSAGQDGAGLYTFGGFLTLTNCTVAGNSIEATGPFLAGGVVTFLGVVTLQNTIVAGNTSAGAPSDLANEDGILGGGFNLIGTGGSGGLANGVNGNLVGVASPGLAPLGNYGGPTQTVGLLAGSPALDAGSNTLAAAAGLTTDQRGLPRVVNGTVDIGAFEYQGPAVITVNSVNDTDARDGVLTLREALLLEDHQLGLGDLTAAERAQVTGGDPGLGNGTDTVVFDSTVFATPQTIVLFGGQLPAMVHSVVIAGPGAALLTIDAHQASAILQVNGSAAISGLTFANGQAQFGGAIFNAGTLALVGCDFTGNSATFGGAVDNFFAGLTLNDCALDKNSASNAGGGIFNSFGGVTLDGCSLSGNAAVTGGGLLNDGPAATLLDCNLTGNQASGVGGAVDTEFGALALTSCDLTNNTGQFGGGIFNDGVKATLTGCTFTGNNANVDAGGGFYNNDGSTATLTNCTFTNNTAAFFGGGIYNHFATATLTNCTLNDNTAFQGGGLNSAGTATLTGCTVDGNSVGQKGGGVYSFGMLSMSRCMLDGNSAATGGGLYDDIGGTATLTGCDLSGNSVTGSGGGFYDFSATATLTGCTLDGNSATNGGAFANQGTVSLAGCTASRNKASGVGGGADNGGAATFSNSTFSTNVGNVGGGFFNDVGDTAVLTGCTLSGNTATAGAGLSNLGAANLTDCTLSGNTANGPDTAGGIDTSSENSNASTTLTNCTVANNTNLNTAGPGGLFAGRYGTGQAAVTLLNTIVAQNSGSQFGNSGASVGPGTFVSLGFNLSSDASGNLVHAGDLQNANPLLAPLGNYGGPTQTMALLPGSPAIDAGTGAGAPATDQRGFGRVNAVDIGAFESQGFTLAVNAGNNQQVTAGTSLPVPLSVRVTANNPLEPVQGGVVTFTGPASGPGGTFPGASLVAAVVVDASGVATAPAFTANSILGTFTVTASAAGGNAVTFHETVVAPKGGPVQKGQTASACFWASYRGQSLIKSLNGGAGASLLGNWLASNLPNLFGAGAGADNLTGKTNSQVAAFFREEFNTRAEGLDAQVLATALAVYVTDVSLAGNVAASFGLKVSQFGVGIATFNVGKHGAAVGMPNGTVMSVMDILRATDALSAGDGGVIYGGNAVERSAAKALYQAINEAGEIG